MSIGIIFDLDGTLLDTLDDLWDATNYALTQYGCPPRTRDEVRRFVGNGAETLIRLSLPGTERDPDLKSVLDTYRTYYNTHCQIKTGPYPGILDALAALKEKYPMSVVSNKPDAAVKPLCRDYFGDIYALGETDDCPRKPAPDMVYKAMHAIGVEKCIYVGDSEVDVVTANNAGVPCLSVSWGFRDEDVLLDAGARHLCRDPKELPAAIERIVSQMD